MNILRRDWFKAVAAVGFGVKVRPNALPDGVPVENT